MHQPFDRRLRRQAQRRGAMLMQGHDFLHRHVGEELEARKDLAGIPQAGPSLHIGKRALARSDTLIVDAGSLCADVLQMRICCLLLMAASRASQR